MFLNYPRSVVDRGELGIVLENADKYVRLNYSPDEFGEAIVKEVDLDDSERRLVVNLFRTFKELEESGKDHIWTFIIKNAFAPLTVVQSHGKFDYVIGNPPWVSWENLPEDYRNHTKSLWTTYGLLESSKSMGLGKVRRDLATLFLARCFDRFVKTTGKLGFVMPFNVLRTQGGGGFRKYLAFKLKVSIIHEVSELYPFEGATNRTGLVIVKPGSTIFPAKCLVWSTSETISQDFDLDAVKKMTRQTSMRISPIENGKAQSPWAIATAQAHEVLKKIVSPSYYKGKEGTNPALIGVYWVKIIEKTPNGLMIKNSGGVKKKVDSIETEVEENLVYPLARGRDIKKWVFNPPEYYIVVPHDPLTGKPISEHK